MTAAQLAFLLAAPFVGSFLGAVAHRLPGDLRGLAGGRSRCDTCGVALGPAELVPVASWLVQRGRCRHCGGTIARDHLVIEVGAIAVAAQSIAWPAVAWPGGGPWWAGCLLGWWLLPLAAIDRRTRLLPDLLTLPLIAVGLGVAATMGHEVLVAHAVGAAAGYLLFAGIALLYRRWRGIDGLGLGDAKLLAAGGAWAGWAALPDIILIAAVAALAIVLATTRGRAGRDHALAFGPFLALGIWLAWSTA